MLQETKRALTTPDSYIRACAHSHTHTHGVIHSSLRANTAIYFGLHEAGYISTKYATKSSVDFLKIYQAI